MSLNKVAGRAHSDEKFFTPEEISKIDKKLNHVVFGWAKSLVNHILSSARSQGVEVVYMNTPRTLDAGGVNPEQIEYFYEKLPPQLGFKKEKAQLRNKGNETLWAYRFGTIEAHFKSFVKTASLVFENIPDKYKGAFIGVVGRKPVYTDEEANKVVELIRRSREKEEEQQKSASLYYYEWEEEKWGDSQRFRRDIKEDVVTQRLPENVRNMIESDPDLSKFWGLMLSQSDHFGSFDSIGFGLVSRISDKIWLINEIQSDCIGEYMNQRNLYWEEKKKKIKEKGKTTTWETVKDRLIGSNRRNWIPILEEHNELRQKLMENVGIIDRLPDDTKDIGAWIAEKTGDEQNIEDLIRHFNSVNFNSRIFKVW